MIKGSVRIGGGSVGYVLGYFHAVDGNGLLDPALLFFWFGRKGWGGGKESEKIEWKEKKRTYPVFFSKNLRKKSVIFSFIARFFFGSLKYLPPYFCCASSSAESC